MPALPTIDPLTLLLIAVIIGGILFLVAQALLRWWRLSRLLEGTYILFFWNGAEWILPRSVYHEIVDHILPEGERIATTVLHKLLLGERVSDADRGKTEWYLSDALNRAMFENPNIARYFTPEVQAEMRQRLDRSRGK